MSPLIEFESSAFPVVPGEDGSTNPGIFGKSLAEWLALELRGRGFIPRDVFAEDFGWCVELESRPHTLYVACSSEDERPTVWRVFVFATGGMFARFAGRDRRAQSISGAFEAVKLIIRSSPHVRNIREDPA